MNCFQSIVFRQRLKVHRDQRHAIQLDIWNRAVHYGRGVGVSKVVGPGWEYFTVWTCSPRCHYLRVISTWNDRQAALASAANLLAVRERRSVSVS